uniref:DNA topoisomerase (ATP-hydrolyzing) n=1 Tax=viral metagenome TaxID=1070528 RepID=A0A6C0D7B9_9ZZZZ
MASEYKKLSHREHILQLPDTYLNSVETNTDTRWLYNTELEKMEYKTVYFNPALLKVFDEVLVNARDEIVRSGNVKHIDVYSGMVDEDYTITVKNDGSGIPIEYSKEKNEKGEFIYTPELIFGHLLTSSNYNKEEEKIVGGKNGYGSKLTNIFSMRFILETLHAASGKLYKQTWKNNMSVCEKPTIKKTQSSKGYVSVTFCPDVTRFQGAFDGANLTSDMEQVFHTRVLEIAAMAGKDIKVTFNGTEIKTNTFEKFVKLFTQNEKNIAYERCSDRWEVAAILTRNLFDNDAVLPDEKQISFVNGINTKKGGKHVETVFKHLIGDFCEFAKKKKIDIKPSQLKDSLLLFVNSTIVNPSFDSQTKETLTTPASKFGSVFKPSTKLVDSLVKIGLLDEAQSILDAKAVKDAKKTDGTKKKTIRGMPKLVDALHAGTAKSPECTLILTEGDSAATSAISGLKVVGREFWGVFPLRGKLLNVRDISQEKFSKNEELTAIKKIIGLEQNKKYNDTKSLRYGRVMIMADQDLDGSHIKGLLMNLFHTEWPTLMKSGFLCSLLTPLLKATRRGITVSFYTIQEFETWKLKNDSKQWTLKYYKGLGTSTPEEAQEWFKNLHEIKYCYDDSTDESFSLAFNKKRSDDRKKWLGDYDSKRIVNVENGKVNFTRFIHDELIHFSNGDNIRSLPSVMDGFKPSQRKILFGCLKRGLRSEVRVAQLAGYVSEHASYHHGEASLQGAIVSLAQTFVGANNINILAPVGQFGSRLLGGKDSASPRYIHTHLEPIVDKIFRKEDACILNHIDDDGFIVEPETYYPTIPMLLINGCVGIGTGFSTDIPPHDPADVVGLLKDRLSGKRQTLENLALRPYWIGFKGPIQMVENGVWLTKGMYTFDDAKKVVSITELPIGTWTHDYKEFLEELCSVNDKESKKPVLKNYEDLYNHVDIRFDLYLEPDYYDDVKDNAAEFEKRFKLTTTWRTSNMVAFTHDLKIKKYDCVGNLMEEYYVTRLAKYEERRQKEIESLKRDAMEADAKARFLRGVLNDTIDLRRKSDEEIVAIMKKHDLPPLSEGKNVDVVDSYEYLLRLRIDRVKASAIEEAEKAVMKAHEALKLLESTTATEIWTRELEEFMNSWSSMKDERMRLLSGEGVKPKMKKTVKK